MKVKLLRTIRSLMLSAFMFAGDFSETFAQQELEQGIPLSLDRRYYLSFIYIHKENSEEQMRVKAGDSWIFSNSQELENFYGPKEAAKLNSRINFSSQAFVLVVTELLDSCKTGDIHSLERVGEDTLKVTMITRLKLPCTSEPAVEHYRLLLFPIERPVAKVDVVYIEKLTHLPK